MSISAISGISTYSPVASIEPLNYSLNSMSNVSDVFKGESPKDIAAVNAARPIQYPNAQLVETDPIEQVQERKATNSRFNSVASKFSDTTVGYDSYGGGFGYSMIGTQIDLFA